MKTLNLTRTLKAVFSLTVAVALLLSCSKDDELTPSGTNVNDESNSVFNETLSPREIDDMNYLIENEKLLRDYFNVMYNKYNLSLFQNVAKSEQSHLNFLAVKFLRYDLKNPTEEKPAGEYVNPELQQTYDIMIAKGETNIYAALLAGSSKVKEDVEDIPLMIDQFEGNADIVLIFSNILIESQKNREVLEQELKVQYQQRQLKFQQMIVICENSQIQYI